jgi:hypothetical protein
MDMLNLLSTGNVSRAASLARIEGKMGTLGDYHGVPPSRRVTSKESRPYRVAITKVETPEFPQRVFSISGINRRIAKGLLHPRAAEMFDADESDRDRP